MKNLAGLMLAGFTAGAFGIAVAQTNTGALPTDNPAAAAAATEGAGPGNSEATAGVASNGVLLDVHALGVDAALKYLAAKAGLAIIREADTRAATGSVDITSATPLSTADLVALLNKVLAQNDLMAALDGNTLTVETIEAARGNSTTPVNVWNGDFASIPQDSVVGTYVITLHSLNPSEVLKDLATLLPADSELNANQGGNAIIMTARNGDVRRFVQLIQALDNSANGDLEVFVLNYADSKSIAQELKDVFSPTDATAGQNGGNPFANLLRTGPGGAANTANNPRRATIHVNAVSDDQNNAVLVSAPADMMPGISNLVTKLDVPQNDSVVIKVYALHHADPSDVVTELTTIFPGPNEGSQQANNGRGAVPQFGLGGLAGGGASAASSTMSERMKKQITVSAVADARTQSVLVTASSETMNQIDGMIAQLDDNPAHQMSVYAFRPQHGDVADMEGPMQALFASTTFTSSSSLVSALQQRQQTAAQNQGFLPNSTFGGTGAGMGTGGSGGGATR